MGTYTIPGLVLTDHTFHVPLDHAQPEGEQITVYAREVVAPQKRHETLPWLVFFQGGPGGKSPRPTDANGWIGRAVQEFRVLLLDQRGTGRSAPANHQSLALRGDAAAQAAYLMHFRADAIVRDAEYIRARLLAPGERWSVLGQSYGGFCILNYLSSAPEALREAFITGGLPSVDASADDVYRHTYRRVLDKNQRYFERYPDDQTQVHAIAMHLLANDVRLPNGERLSPRRLQWLGLGFGMSDGFEAVHYLIEEAFITTVEGETLSDTFLYGVMNQTTLATNPLFAVIHEPIYAQGVANTLGSRTDTSGIPTVRGHARPAVFVYWRDDLPLDVRRRSSIAATQRGRRTAGTSRQLASSVRRRTPANEHCSLCSSGVCRRYVRRAHTFRRNGAAHPWVSHMDDQRIRA